MLPIVHDLQLLRTLPPYFVRLGWYGRRAGFTVAVAPSWRRWRERRGVGRIVWGKPK